MEVLKSTTQSLKLLDTSRSSGRGRFVAKAKPIATKFLHRKKSIACTTQGRTDDDFEKRSDFQLRRNAILGVASATLFVSLPEQDALASYNIEKAKESGRAAREEREQEVEEPGELVKKESGLKYREIAVGTKGQPAVLGAVIDIQYTVYKFSSGAYFKESSGGKPVYLWSLGYGKEGKDDLLDVYRLTLGETDTLPSAVAPAVVGMRAGGLRRVLVPPRYGWANNDNLKPRPVGFGASRRLENHKNEPLLFDLEVKKVTLPPGVVTEDVDFDEMAASMLPPGYNRVIQKPPPSALSYNSVVYVSK